MKQARLLIFTPVGLRAFGFCRENLEKEGHPEEKKDEKYAQHDQPAIPLNPGASKR
jgi:hypothetical protein